MTKKCTTCNREVTNDYIELKCPNCNKAVIIRCMQCRELSNTYVCPECGFQGP
ncbi:MAG: RNA-binding protein [Candidatus Diapherotrites archaeon]|nr:RNA-binding protein [Candidatus Diapherotrites archaeon]MCK5632147.1 RNA-binding protein [bacterium]